MSRQTVYSVMISKYDITTINYFLAPSSEVLLIGYGHTDDVVEMHYKYRVIFSNIYHHYMIEPLSDRSANGF